MKSLRFIITAFVLALAAAGSQAATSSKYEVRAATVVTDGGLDWPCGVLAADRQQSSMRELLRRLSDSNFNTVYLQAQAGGAALWHSDFLPPMIELTGHAGQRPDYDPVSMALDECRYLGLSCHAVVNVLDFGTLAGAARYASASTPHLAATHPDYCFNYQGRWYLDPGNPGAREFIVSVCRELLSRYDFDGVLFDGLYYPGTNVDDVTNYQNFNPDYLPRDRWRRSSLDALADDLYTMAKSVDPGLNVGFTSLAAYRSLPGYSVRSAYGTAYQDPVKWISDGVADYLAPKMTISERDGFTAFVDNWVSSAAGGEIRPILHPSMMDDGVSNWTDETLSGQIETIRSNAGLRGMALDHARSVLGDGGQWSAKFAGQLRDGHFRYPAFVPPGQNAGAQLPPVNVSAEWNGTEYKLTWDEPFSVEGTGPRFYSVYLTQRDGSVDVSDMDNLLLPRVTSTEARVNSPIDGLTFAVTAWNDGYRESAPALSAKAGLDDVSTLTTRFRRYGELIEVVSQNTISRIEIYNIAGTLLRSIKVNGNQAVIETGVFPRAVYVARVLFEGAAPSVDKFIR